VLDLCPLNKKVLEAWVCVFAVLDMSEGFQRWILLAMIPDWEIVRILFSKL
jgi:hypothetical protein